MQTFTYERASDLDGGRGAVAPGRSKIPRRRHQPPRPHEARHRSSHHLVDITRLPLEGSRRRPRAGCSSARRTATASLPPTARATRYPLLSQALLAGASGQLRNKASTGGNLLQRTRCHYFLDPTCPATSANRGPAAPPSRLQPDSRHPGRQRILHRPPPVRHGGAMAALDASVETVRPTAKPDRSPSASSIGSPGNSPEIETTLAHGEMITAVALPSPPPGRQVYRKVRDRASYAFALVSVAAMVEVRRRSGPRAGRTALWRCRSQAVAGQ